MQIQQTYFKNEVHRSAPHIWDMVALILVFGVLLLLGWGAKSMTGQYQLGEVIPITLDPRYLPYYALRTVLRMFIALGASLVFTFIFGTWAAKSKEAEKIIIPMIDIMQSVPVLGFLSISVTSFIALFHGSMLGPECAAIFAIFTAQVWNITLSFYQSLRSIPKDLIEVTEMFHLSAWQRFWKLEVPYATPALVWNLMVSMSSSWIFLVASEAITVAHYDITLPGIGSYIALAITKADQEALYFVFCMMFVVIACYDQLFFRPLIAWIEKFKAETRPDEVIPESWVLNLFQRARWTKQFSRWVGRWVERFVNCEWFRYQPQVKFKKPMNPKVGFGLYILFWILFISCLIAAILGVFHFIFETVPLKETQHVLYLGFITAIRIALMIILSSLIWVPIGVWIGLHPRASQKIQPIVQFAAAFPVNLLFPFVVYFILRHHLNVNIWTSPLMILGAQWYIVFNVIAGTSAIPEKFHQAVGMMKLHSWLWWKRFMLPAIFPYYVTGAITAAGGAWNISIIAEAVNWGHTELNATGLGAYIAHVADVGNFQKLTLGIMMMSLYVVVINRVFWRPLYNLAVERFQL